MRRRVKRDLGILAGIVIVLGGVAFVNYNVRRGDLAEIMDRKRRQVENMRESKGLELLKWSLLRETKGTYRSGPKFDDHLMAKNGQKVDIVGFMVPLEQFRQVSEFLLLPLPLECYFCRRPPMRDVMLVRLDPNHRKVDIYEEPVIVNGDLTLNEGPKQKFFYTLANAKMGPGNPEDDLTRRKIPEEHMVPQHDNPEDLLEGYDPKIGQNKRDLVVEDN